MASHCYSHEKNVVWATGTSCARALSEEQFLQLFHCRLLHARQRAEVMAEAFQSRVSKLLRDFTAWDDPFQREEIWRNRIIAREALENTEAEMVRLDQEIRDIREEARRAGVPPGWLR